MLKVNHLSKEYTQGTEKILALDDVSMNIETGDTVSIVGPSGSGKTTLLSLITGLDSPSHGSVVINDKDITKMTEVDLAHFRAKNMGIVFQQFHLMNHLTAQENVQLPLEILGLESVEDRAREALKSVNLEDRASHKPDQLSGGERQRVAIARAFVAEPKYLFADEPSGNLDQSTGDKVLDILFKEADDRQMTLILVTHDIELAKRCRKPMQMNNGHLM